MTRPVFADKAMHIVSTALRPLSVGKLKALLEVSDALGTLNHERYRDFCASPVPGAEKHAVLAYMGDAYQGLDAASLDDSKLSQLQDHLLMLSGLYGVVRPLDAIQPYRLDMGTRLRVGDSADLYSLWREDVAREVRVRLESLQAAAPRGEEALLVNCASDEYFKCVDTKAALPAGARLVNTVFKDQNGGTYRILSVFAKRARGLFVRYVATRGAATLDALKQFDLEGYRLEPRESTDDTLVFVRSAADREAAKKAATSVKAAGAPGVKGEATGAGAGGAGATEAGTGKGSGRGRGRGRGAAGSAGQSTDPDLASAKKPRGRAGVGGLPADKDAAGLSSACALVHEQVSEALSPESAITPTAVPEAADVMAACVHSPGRGGAHVARAGDVHAQGHALAVTTHRTLVHHHHSTATDHLRHHHHHHLHHRHHHEHDGGYGKGPLSPVEVSDDTLRVEMLQAAQRFHQDHDFARHQREVAALGPPEA